MKSIARFTCSLFIVMLLFSAAASPFAAIAQGYTAYAPPAAARGTTAPAFGDVSAADWFYPYVRSMYERGVMRGVSADRFAPSETFNRAQIIATLFRIHNSRSADRAVDGVNHPFHADVHSGAWYEPYVAWAYVNNISAGASVDFGQAGDIIRRFGPSDAVERQEIAAIMHNYVANMTGLPPDAFASSQWFAFTDREEIIGDAFYIALVWANNNEIIRGRTATAVAPSATATRAEAAAMLSRLINLVENAPPPLADRLPQIPQLPVREAAHAPPDDPLAYNEAQAEQDTHVDVSLDFELRVLELVNQERAVYGIAPLQWHEELGAAARAHSMDMAIRLFFSHTCPSGTSFAIRISGAGISFFTAGENIAMGQRTAEQVVSSWMNSPGHRANILNPGYTHMGVGLYVGTERVSPNVPPYFWTQKFIGG